MSEERECIDNVESLERALARVRKAQEIFGTYSQEQVDKIFAAAAIAANQARIPLAEMAVEETGMGIVEDKVIKNHYAAEYIYNAYRYTKTCGVIEENKAYGIKKLAEPIGVIAAVIPTTNPTSTVIFKTLIALKTRNGIIISPHPRAKNSSIQAAKIILDAAVKAGAPEGIIDWIDAPSLDLTNKKMIRKKEKKRRFAGKYRGCAFPTTNKKTLLRHFLSYISLPLQSFSVFLQAINWQIAKYFKNDRYTKDSHYLKQHFLLYNYLLNKYYLPYDQNLHELELDNLYVNNLMTSKV